MLIVYNKIFKRKTMNKNSVPIEIQIKIKSKVLDKLINHLQKRNDVQNIDLMNLSGFCRNCLSKWYSEVSKTEGFVINYNSSREIIYGMPYNKWKSKYQKQASEEQLNNFEK